MCDALSEIEGSDRNHEAHHTSQLNVWRHTNTISHVDKIPYAVAMSNAVAPTADAGISTTLWIPFQELPNKLINTILAGQ